MRVLIWFQRSFCEGESEACRRAKSTSIRRELSTLDTTSIRDSAEVTQLFPLGSSPAESGAGDSVVSLLTGSR